MPYAVSFLKIINKMFKLPVHPFNMQNEGIKSYAQWQYEKGEETIKFFLDYTSKEDMFYNKTVLDVGCGAAGKSLYYASCGADRVVGIDVVGKYKNEAMLLAESLNLKDKFEFFQSDAAKTDFQDQSFDTIIMNDAMEHVDKPDEVLKECHRILKPGGKLYVNFPPYNHPFGAHLSDAIGIPWVHLFFSDKTLISVYKDLVKHLPDGQERIKFRISKKDNGKEYFSYINKMTIRRFYDMLQGCILKPVYLKEVPLRSILKPVAHMSVAKEFLVKMVICVFEKSE